MCKIESETAEYGYYKLNILLLNIKLLHKNEAPGTVDVVQQSW